MRRFKKLISKADWALTRAPGGWVKQPAGKLLSLDLHIQSTYASWNRMGSKWESYSRTGVKAASTATSVGFSAAKMGTKLGVRSASNFVDRRRMFV